MSKKIDIKRQVEFWSSSAIEDWETAQELIDSNRVRHGLFFAHLALEKLLKAHVCHHTQKLSPRIHNLIRLAKLANLSLNHTQKNILAEMNSFNLTGRYPDSLLPPPSKSRAIDYMQRAKTVYQWLIHQL